MANGIPRAGGRLKRFFTQATPYDIALSLVAVVPGVAGAWRFLSDNKPVAGWLCVAAATIGCLLTMVKAAVLWWYKPEEQPPHDLAGCLHALHAILLALKGSDVPDPRLRLTIHVPVGQDKLEQVLDYVGDQRGGRSAPRTFSVHSGIIGKAYREQKACVGSRKNDDYETYIKELVEEWGYTEAEARKLNPSSKSWMAVPLLNLLDQRKVEGIVYIDAVEKDFFTEVQKGLVLFACVGIAQYVAQKYK
jgi:hypothetical protein